MPYTDASKRKMVQKMTTPNVVSASDLSNLNERDFTLIDKVNRMDQDIREKTKVLFD